MDSLQFGSKENNASEFSYHDVNGQSVTLTRTKEMEEYF